MTWVKLPNTFTEDVRWVGCSSDALALFAGSLCYSDRNLLDGRIPAVLLPRLTLTVPPENVETAAAELVAAGLWTEEGNTFQVVDYADYCYMAEQVKATRERWQDDKRRQAAHRNGDHSQCTNPKYCPAIRNGSTLSSSMESTKDSSMESTRDSTVASLSTTQPDSTRPDPTQPDRRERVGAGSGKRRDGKADGTDSAKATPAPSPADEEENKPAHPDNLPRNYGGLCDCDNPRYVDAECIRCGGGEAA